MWIVDLGISSISRSTLSFTTFSPWQSNTLSFCHLSIRASRTVFNNISLLLFTNSSRIISSLKKFVLFATASLWVGAYDHNNNTNFHIYMKEAFPFCAQLFILFFNDSLTVTETPHFTLCFFVSVRTPILRYQPIPN